MRMPFDSNVGYANSHVTVSPRTINDGVVAAGLKPISMDVLKRYKEEQVRKHPGNPLAQLSGQVMLLGGMTLMITFMVIGLFFMTGLPSLLVGVILPLPTAIGYVILMDRVKVKRPAQWTESGFYYGVPAKIDEALAKLISTGVVRGVRVGVLYQDKVALDPYLLAYDAYDNIVCLGIWDGDEIIACA